MDSWWVVTSTVLAVILVVAMVLLRSRVTARPVESVTPTSAALAQAPHAWPLTPADEPDEVFIPLELLPAQASIDLARLSEITDRTVLARISQAVPAIAETAAKTAARGALKSMDVYRVVIPSGATLARSRDVDGAFRGIYRGAKVIRGHADLVKVDVAGKAAVAGGVSSVMNVGSLVVGQYYMAVISSKLDELKQSVDKVGDFQGREFKSRIVSLITHVGEVARFSAEIMEDETESIVKRNALEGLRKESTELLEQVNITMTDLTHTSAAPSYNEYEQGIGQLAILVEYQVALLAVLGEISELTYLLGRGTISPDKSRFLLDVYLERSSHARESLSEWHRKQIELLRLDLAKERRAKTGLDALLGSVPGVFDEKWKHRMLGEGLAAEIDTQLSPLAERWGDFNKIYDEDVEIIIKNGRLYLLPEAEGPRAALDDCDHPH